jgi:hypothetical protein
VSDVTKLSGVVNRPDWDMLMVWLHDKKVECHDKLEVCQPENVRGLQGELRVIKELLTLRDTVNRINK